MPPKTLKFLVPETDEGLVPNYEMAELGTRSFIGHKWSKIDELTDQWGWVKTSEAQEVPYLVSAPGGRQVVSQYAPSYIQACKQGHLLPADAETAEVCGVLFPRELAEGEKLEDAGELTDEQKAAVSAVGAELSSDNTGEALPPANEDNVGRFASSRKKA